MDFLSDAGSSIDTYGFDPQTMTDKDWEAYEQYARDFNRVVGSFFRNAKTFLINTVVAAPYLVAGTVLMIPSMIPYQERNPNYYQVQERPNLGVVHGGLSLIAAEQMPKPREEPKDGDLERIFTPQLAILPEELRIKDDSPSKPIN